MDRYLDQSIGDNVKLLPDLLRSLQKERDSLTKQLSGVGSLEDESEWQSVVTDVRSTIYDLESLGLRGNSLERSVAALSGELDNCVTDLKPLVQELSELEHLKSYLLWLKRINQLCNQMKTHLSSSMFVDVLPIFTSLSALCLSLNESSCSNLKHYATASKLYWHSQLKEELSSELGVILKELQWPFTASALSFKALESWTKHEKKFTELFDLLMKLDDRDIPTTEKELSIIKLSDPLPLPLEILLQPLRKRFKYHFYGQRKTNSKEKPEWYLTQVSTWIRDHSYFLDNQVQPLLDVSGYGQTNARVEFIRGLLQEIESKLLSDILDIVYENVPMSHLIDELLVFERELRTVHQYPYLQPSPFDVLLGEVPFHKWLTLEKAFSIERLHTITSSETAWQVAYSCVAEADDTRVPVCTEGFMELIKGITERYKSLSSKSHQNQFLELQCDLLLEFHQDLVTNSTQTHPLSTLFIAYLNASNYIAVVLREWGEHTFFLELHYCTSNDSASLSHTLSSVQTMRRQDSEYAASEGSVFSTVIEAFSSLVERLEAILVESVLELVRLKCHQYKKEKWHSMVLSSKDQLGKEVTPSALALLSTLSDSLLLIEDNLSPLLSREVFETIFQRTDQLIYSEIILTSHFSEGGAEQIHHDVTALFLPLLSRYSDDMARRQLMERTLEACKLLQLLPGSAKLLQELLAGATRRPSVSDESYAAAVTTLNDMGIHTLDPAQAELILKLRI